MKFFSLSFFFIAIGFFSCQQKDTSNANNKLETQVRFLQPGPCCSNMEIMNLEPVFSEMVGYSETILAAINIDDFNTLGFENGDSLRIEYFFSSELFPCEIICNRQHGIPIELIGVVVL